MLRYAGVREIKAKSRVLPNNSPLSDQPTLKITPFQIAIRGAPTSQ